MWLHYAHSSEEAPDLLDTMKSTFWWKEKKKSHSFLTTFIKAVSLINFVARGTGKKSLA